MDDGFSNPKNIEKIEYFMSDGNYYNDLEMIKTADIGAAVQGSPEELRQCADYVTRRSCEQGAVADFIDFLADKLSAK